MSSSHKNMKRVISKSYFLMFGFIAVVCNKNSEGEDTANFGLNVWPLY